MGSRGSGAFGNYKPARDEDLCMNEIKGESLEEVARLPYFQGENKVPSKATDVRVVEQLHNRRIAVECVLTGLIIGYLPTKYSYLLSCMKKGINYFGNVDFSADRPIPKVTVNIRGE